MKRFLIAFLLCFIIFGYCTLGECKRMEDSSHKDTLVIGLVPEQNIFQNTLLNMHQDPVGARVLMAFGARRFVRTTSKDYEPILRYTREARLNLARYDYVDHP